MKKIMMMMLLTLLPINAAVAGFNFTSYSTQKTTSWCQPVGEFCNVDRECCSGTCDRAMNSCVNLYCSEVGEPCSFDDDCCSTTCNLNSGRCEYHDTPEPPQCQFEYAPCQDDIQCCSGFCHERGFCQGK